MECCRVKFLGFNERNRKLYEKTERNGNFISKWPGFILCLYFIISQMIANLFFLFIDYRKGIIDSSQWYYQMNLQ